MTDQHRRLALIPTLLPQGEGLSNPSPCGRGAGVRAAWAQQINQLSEQFLSVALISEPHKSGEERDD